MATKTFIPQGVRMLRKVRAYYNKHAAVMNKTLSAAEQTAFKTASDQAAVFDGAIINEDP